MKHQSLSRGFPTETEALDSPAARPGGATTRVDPEMRSRRPASGLVHAMTALTGALKAAENALGANLKLDERKRQSLAVAVAYGTAASSEMASLIASLASTRRATASFVEALSGQQTSIEINRRRIEELSIKWTEILDCFIDDHFQRKDLVACAYKLGHSVTSNNAGAQLDHLQKSYLVVKLDHNTYAIDIERYRKVRNRAVHNNAFEGAA